MSSLAITLLLAVSGANAVPVTPSFFDSYTSGILTGGASVNDVYSFEAGADTNLSFGISVNHPNAVGTFSIANMVLTWTDAGGSVMYNVTDAFGVMNSNPFPVFFHALMDGASGMLTVVGTALTNGGSYSLTVAAVPLPPAVIAFSTAMLGVGFLARRRRKKKAVFA
ncbi:MAG: hypothetical protein JKY84_06060 [Emcibacteraceae bacterium]|nr:hypothetical protein [Emcibacteraceae bacterium]